MLTCSSPWLFAACHVLRRQSVPWHPPCALISLICSPQPFVDTVAGALSFFLVSLISLVCSCQGALYAIPESDIVKRPSEASVRPSRGSSPRLLFASAGLTRPLDLGLSLSAFRRFGSLPRKEVIQPHLPIRLPCYDFTPVIRPALGRLYELWAFPTPMV